MTVALSSVGVKLQRESAVPGTYTDIPGCTVISGPSGGATKIDVTSLDSTGGAREYIAGFREPGEVTTTIQFNPGNAVHLALRSDWAAGAAHNYRIVIPLPAKDYWLTFSAIITTSGLSFDPGKAQEMAVTFGISGAVTEGLEP